MEGINGALTLMAIGMGTVFLMLVLVIVFSRLLIKITNKFPADEPAATAKNGGHQQEVPSKIIAAIAAAIGVASKGKAKVVKVEKVK